ncbi:gephyrin-like molybdotransferase receptor GlpR [Frankia sp. AgB1.8]|uniref:gephyrin-like molybdotransferase receptor GlpR n=1 Tax=Frankia sp. AgB1.8 TaxID=2792839 RepID=UPI001A38C687|nr:hypothetical protein [Frankia sp. AgB1.8]
MSALIWLAIVGVWGFVLIPMWLRRHDGALEQRSADRFSTAMRVLSRRGGRAQPEQQTETDLGDGLADEDDEADDADDLESTIELQTRPAATADDASGGRQTAAARPAGDPSGPIVARAAAGPAVPTRADVAAPGHGAVPARPAARSQAVAGDERGELDETAHTVAVDAARPVPPSRPVDPERHALLRLRRQRLYVLLAAVPVTVGLAVGLAGMWIVVQALVDVGLGAYVAHLRRSARTERRLAASRAARDRRIAADRAARRSIWPGPAHDSAGVPGARTATSPARATSPAASQQGRQGRSGDTVTAAPAGRPHVSAGGRSASSPEYAPVRLSDERGTPLSSEELATARAETVELAATSPAIPVAPEPVAVDDVYTNNVRVTAARPAGRPTVRPPTSRPGRVQVNPPGTHGGLTAPPQPAAAAPAATPPAAPGMPGTPEEGTPTDAEVAAIRLLRPAVGN